MSLVTLNIGLAVPGTDGSIGAGYAAATAETLGHIVGMELRTVKHNQGEEQTLIVDIAPPPGTGHTRLKENIAVLSERLHQDCVAVWFHGAQGGPGHGELLGPKAADWGAFNPIYFHYLSNKGRPRGTIGPGTGARRRVNTYCRC